MGHEQCSDCDIVRCDGLGAVTEESVESEPQVGRLAESRATGWRLTYERQKGGTDMSSEACEMCGVELDWDETCFCMGCRESRKPKEK